MKVAILVLLVVGALTSCSGRGGTFVFYVVIEPDEAARFTRAVTTIAKEDGLETAVGQSVSDTGDIFRVVEGRGHGLKLWVQSTPQSGREDPKLCGVYSEPHADPAQFTVATEPRLFGSEAEAKELGERVFSQIQNLGFDARREPAICGMAALRDHS